MFNGIIFFTYVFAGIVQVLALMLIFITTKHQKTDNQKLLSAIRNFTICTLLITSLYFYMEYKVLAIGIYQASPLFRILDTGSFIGQIYFWTAFIREKSLLNPIAKQKMQCTTVAATAFCSCLVFVSYLFLLDHSYMPVSPERLLPALLIELLLCIYMITVLFWHFIKGLEEIMEKESRRYVSVISLTAAINGLWNSILIFPVMTSHYDLAEKKGIPMDPTPLLLFFVGLFTFILIYREDFSALFHKEKSLPDQEFSLIQMDTLAELHRLTNREREVFELAYRGMTNPEIAEELLISKYTVKRHMHNIFEKLDISTRMELVYLVDHKLNLVNQGK